MAVTTDELAGSPKASFRDGRLVGKRRVKIAWTDWKTYAQELMPVSFTTGSSISTQIGQQFPGIPQLRVQTFDINPFMEGDAGILGTDSDGLVYYEFAVVDIEYAVPPVGTIPELPNQPVNFDPVPLLQHKMGSGGQFLTVPATGLIFQTDSGALPSGTPMGIFISTTQHSVTFPYNPSPNWTALETAKGKVNSDAFTLRGYAYPKECLMYLGYDGEETIMSNGDLSWNITMKFESKIVPAADSALVGSAYGGHNHFWDEDSRGFYRIVKTGGVIGLHLQYNFAQLFATTGND